MKCLTIFMFACAVSVCAIAQKEGGIPITVINSATDKVGNLFAEQLVQELSVRSGNSLCDERSCSSSSADSLSTTHNTPTYWYFPPAIPNTTGRIIVSVVSANDDSARSDKDSTISAISIVLLWDERQEVNPQKKLEFIHQRVIVLPMQSAMSRAHQMLYDIDSDIKDNRQRMNSLAKPTAK